MLLNGGEGLAAMALRNENIMVKVVLLFFFGIMLKVNLTNNDLYLFLAKILNLIFD